MMNPIQDYEEVLSPDTLKAMFKHAERCYPEECCGFVLANSTIHCGSNIQSELNRANPDRFIRDSATGYTFSFTDLKLLNNSLNSSNPVVLIYHSHPDVGAYFSDEDKDKALFLGQPAYPVGHVVIDVKNGISVGAKVFQWNGSNFITSMEIS